jgi:hypothetical protein
MQRIKFSQIGTKLLAASPGIYEIRTNEGKILKVGIGGDLRRHLKQHGASLDRRLQLKAGGQRDNPGDVVSKGSILAKHLYYDSTLTDAYDLQSEVGRRSFLENECHILFTTTSTREEARVLEIERETDPSIRYIGRVIIRTSNAHGLED